MPAAMAEKSTSVRIHSAPPAALRLAFAAGGALAPSLAARAAARLFLTPAAFAAPGREREALAAARPFSLRHRGRILNAWRFGPGPTVLLVHGWGGRGGQLASVAAALGRAGLGAVTFDGPAHGTSGGRIASVAHFADAVAAMADHVGARAAVGHSMGAASIALALSRGLRLDAAVFLAPPRSPAPFLARFCEVLGIPPAVQQRARRHLEESLEVSFADLDLLAFAPAMQTPLLVAHDRGDDEVPFETGAAIAEAWPGARLLSTSGLGHRRILRSPEVGLAAAGFLAEHVEFHSRPFDRAVAGIAERLW